MATKLTVQQQHFADLVLTGSSFVEAYREAYTNNSLNKGVAAVNASRLAALPKVAEYMDAVKARRTKETELTRSRKRQILGGIALDVRAPDSSRIMAIRADNEMTGDNAPVRVQGEIALFEVFQSMGLSTGLPTTDEIKRVRAAKRVVALPAPTDVEATPVPDQPLTTAMERVG